jgi:hypothetical protein
MHLQKFSYYVRLLPLKFVQHSFTTYELCDMCIYIYICMGVNNFPHASHDETSVTLAQCGTLGMKGTCKVFCGLACCGVATLRGSLYWCIL